MSSIIQQKQSRSSQYAYLLRMSENNYVRYHNEFNSYFINSYSWTDPTKSQFTQFFIYKKLNFFPGCQFLNFSRFWACQFLNQFLKFVIPVVRCLYCVGLKVIDWYELRVYWALLMFLVFFLLLTAEWKFIIIF